MFEDEGLSPTEDFKEMILFSHLRVYLKQALMTCLKLLSEDELAYLILICVL